jgi:DNA mismatch repair ATPase MutS
LLDVLAQDDVLLALLAPERDAGGGFELAQLADSLPRLRNYNVLVREWLDDIVFLHKIAPGSADKSYGIHVARLAGVPPEVLERARQVLADLEAHHLGTSAPPPAGGRRHRSKQPSLFAQSDARCCRRCAISMWIGPARKRRWGI